MKRENNNSVKTIAWLLIILFVIPIFSPTGSLLIANNPGNDFSGPASTSAEGLVDMTTGELSYSLPLLNVPGTMGSSYSMNLNYLGNANVNATASWVGLGWSFTPGELSRSVDGIPDDYNNQSVIRYNKAIPSWTITKRHSGNLEIASADFEEIQNADSLNFSGNLI